jgi:hypothetical protein
VRLFTRQSLSSNARAGGGCRATLSHASPFGVHRIHASLHSRRAHPPRPHSEILLEFWVLFDVLYSGSWRQRERIVHARFVCKFGFLIDFRRSRLDHCIAPQTSACMFTASADTLPGFLPLA